MRAVLLLSFLIFPLTASSQFNPLWVNFFESVPDQNEFVEGVAFDDNGYAYLTGRVYDPAESDNIITLKVDPDGNEVFFESYNGIFNGADEGYGIYVDEAGYVYVTGRVSVMIGSYAATTIKYSPTGAIEWVHTYDGGGQVSAQGTAVTVDPNGIVYVTGWAEGPSTSGRDLLVLKVDSLGQELDVALLTQVAGQTDEGYDIAVGADGNIYVTAFSLSSTGDGYEILLVKYDPDLNIFWTQHINGTDDSSNEFPIDLILDSSTNIHVLARIQNTGASTDFAVYKFEPVLGDTLWTQEFDANNGQDIPYDMVLDESGNVYVTGRARPDGGYNDFATIKYNSAGAPQWTSYYNGPNSLDDDPVGIAIGGGGNILVCGESNRTGSNFEFIVVQYDESNGEFDGEWVHDVNASSKAYGVSSSGNGALHAAGEGEGPGGNQDFMVVGWPGENSVNGGTPGFPVVSELSQNYPNPFNPVSNFEFRVSSLSNVTLRVYDLLGKEVATIVDEKLSPGTYTRRWDAAGLPSGVYFYKLQAAGYVETRKLVLLK